MDVGEKDMAVDCPDFRRILVPLDGSEQAEQVMPLVRAEAIHHGAVVVLLRVVPPLRQGLIMVPSIVDDLNAQAEQLAEDYLAQVTDELRADGLQVETMVEFGPPADRILAVAEDTECDLIVIGSHGQSGARVWRFGSVANKVIKVRTSMPVLVVNT
jgi:nucleotide-binding universal stress UspA family protein